jgi:hypothetical protein
MFRFECEGESFTAVMDHFIDTVEEFAEVRPWRDPFLNWMERYMNSVDCSDSWHDVSPTYTYHRCPGNPSVVLDPKRGYKTVVEHLLVCQSLSKLIRCSCLVVDHVKEANHNIKKNIVFLFVYYYYFLYIYL